ncbi:uncharacterized protein TNCT_615871 [Trichonephila clavata]|uniref:Uncharacterized protein n=1 Tax=Trichonephila clavata TaxID=2740835 RepID=A0A8X6FFR2_TRICU|nr:uncharacterized protein TNCT_615871 [Trichonephila clavata]
MKKGPAKSNPEIENGAGSIYNKKAESSSDELAVGRTGFMNTTKGSEIETVQPVSIDVPSSEQTVSEDLKPAFNVSNTFQSSCYCTYTNQDSTLAAYAGTDLLHVGSRVKSNSTVKFHCYQTGYARLSGPTEIQCQNCQWTTVKFPVCLQPQIGETTFQIVSPYMLLPGGIIGIEKGKSLIINCYSNGYSKVPTWRGPKDIDHFTLTSGWENLSSQYYNQLTITNIDQHHNGLYECLVTGFSPSDIFIQVINPVAAKCPKLEDDDLRIEYGNEQLVNTHSTAVFSCKGPNQILVGSRVLTCMHDGRWSGLKPQCKKLCPEIRQQGMVISYTAGQNIGSIAAFRCFAPRRRIGVFHTTCEQNGEWKDPIPTCTSVPGCNRPLGIQDSDLTIEPNKYFYRLGEIVTLSCPAGQVLSSETVRLLCISTGWSQKDLPRCIYV